MGILKRIVDRRAAKNGPVVTWWRRVFGVGAADVIENAAVSRARQMLQDAYRQRRGELTAAQFANRWPQELALARESGLGMVAWAKAHVAALEADARRIA